MSRVSLIRCPSHASRMREEGQTMAEYGVVLTMITVAIVTAFSVFATQIESAFVRVVRLIELIT
jgi:Flp pilus assembly pilin Flp